MVPVIGDKGIVISVKGNGLTVRAYGGCGVCADDGANAISVDIHQSGRTRLKITNIEAQLGGCIIGDQTSATACEKHKMPVLGYSRKIANGTIGNRSTQIAAGQG